MAIKRKVVAATLGAFVAGGVGAATFAGAIAVLVSGALLRHGVALSAEEIAAIDNIMAFLVSGSISAAGAFAAGWRVVEPPAAVQPDPYGLPEVHHTPPMPSVPPPKEPPA